MRTQRTTPNLPRFRQNLNPVVHQNELHIPQNHQGPLLESYQARKPHRKQSTSDQWSQQQERAKITRPPKSQLPVCLLGKNGQSRGRNVQLEKQKFLMTSYKSPRVDFVKKLGEPKKDLQSVKKAHRARLKDKLMQIKSEWQGADFTINVDSNLDQDANRNSNLLKPPSRNLFPAETMTQFDKHNNQLNICAGSLEAQIVNSDEEIGQLEDRRTVAQYEYGQPRCGTPNNGLFLTKGVQLKEGLPSAMQQSWQTKPSSPRGGYQTTRQPRRMPVGWGTSRNQAASSFKNEKIMRTGSQAKSGQDTAVEHGQQGRYHLCTQFNMRPLKSHRVAPASKKSSISSIRSNNSRGPPSRGTASRGAIQRGIISRNTLSKGTLAEGSALNKDLKTYILGKKTRKVPQRQKKVKLGSAKSSKAIPSPNLLWVESLNKNLKRQLEKEKEADLAHKNYLTLTCATHVTQTGMTQESPPQKRPFSQQQQHLDSISPPSSRNKSRNNTNIYAAPSKPLSELHKQITIHQERHLSNQNRPTDTQPTINSIQKSKTSKLFQIITNEIGSYQQPQQEVKKQPKKSRNPSKENPRLNSVPSTFHLQLIGRQIKTPKASHLSRGAVINRQGSQILFQEQLLKSVKAPRVFTLSDKMISLKKMGH